MNFVNLIKTDQSCISKNAIKDFKSANGFKATNDFKSAKGFFIGVLLFYLWGNFLIHLTSCTCSSHHSQTSQPDQNSDGKESKAMEEDAGTVLPINENAPPPSEMTVPTGGNPSAPSNILPNSTPPFMDSLNSDSPKPSFDSKGKDHDSYTSPVPPSNIDQEFDSEDTDELENENPK